MTANRDIAALKTTESAGRSYIEDYGRRFMVVAGINSYQDASGNNLSLKTPVADACRIFSILKDQFGFDGYLLAERSEVQNCKSSLGGDESLEPWIAGNGTAADIVQVIWDLAQKARPEDLFLFYYGGHGVIEKEMGFLLPYGTAWGRHETYLMYPTLFGAFEALPSLHKLLFFDCCFSGVITKGIAGAQAPEGGGNRKVLLEPAMATFASTDAHNVAPDQFQAWQNKVSSYASAHSPFADALACNLENMEPNKPQIPAEIQSALYHGVRDRIKKIPNARGQEVPLSPVAKMTGTAPILLRKQGMRILMQDSIVVRANEKKQIEIGLAGKDIAEARIDLKEPVKGVTLTGSKLSIDGSRLDVGETMLTVKVYEQSSLRNWKQLHIIRPSEEREPLLVETRDLPPCFVEENYRAKIEVVGGKPPIDLKAKGLPEGLELSVAGELYGKVARQIATGGGFLSEFVVTASDSAGEIYKRLAIPIIDPQVYVSIPAGEFRFGYEPSKRREKALNGMNIPHNILEKLIEDHPADRATVPSFFIRRHPVTNHDWEEFLEQTGPSREDDQSSLSAEGDRPVTGLRGQDVEAFCDWRNTRLPSRFQWERAARGTNGSLFPWGDFFDTHYCNCREQHGNAYETDMVKENLDLFLTSAKQYSQGASPDGVEDMVGNAWELTRHVLLDDQNQPYLARMGGSVSEGGANLTACFGCRMKYAVRGQLQAGENSMSLADEELLPLTGFRDVIELAQSPPYRQGFVKMPASSFSLEWAGSIHLPNDVYIARYEVSNAEYAEFVRSTDRRALPKHWSSSGEWYFSYQWRFHPVVNLTYNDVCGFCDWKSKKLGVCCYPLNETVWRLAVHTPRAGSNPQKYPWGDDYRLGICNHPSAGFGGTVAVFELPEGRAACGAWNMVGNVAEWVGEKKVAGGSWLHGIRSPESFVARNDEPRSDVGFRYFTFEPPLRE